MARKSPELTPDRFQQATSAVGKAVHKIRIAKRISLAEAVSLISLTEGEIKDFEQGVGPMGLKKFIMIAEGLRMTPAALMNEADKILREDAALKGSIWDLGTPKVKRITALVAQPEAIS